MTIFYVKYIETAPGTWSAVLPISAASEDEALAEAGRLVQKASAGEEYSLEIESTRPEE